MTIRPFDFLLSLPESQARQWLARYLLGERTDPAVDVPFDYGRLEFLLNEVSPIPDMALPLRVGDLAGAVLAEVIATRSLQSVRPGLVKALFTVVESLPVSETVVTLLNDLAVAGTVLAWPSGDGTDFHLLTLRALVLHQRPAAGQIDRLIDFWKREANDLRYASVAIQGLLRAAPRAALEVIPDFVDRASNARPPLPLANLLFAVSIELGDDQRLWRHFVTVLLRNAQVFEATKEGFAKIRLSRTNPAAWQLFDAPSAPTTTPARLLGAMDDDPFSFFPAEETDDLPETHVSSMQDPQTKQYEPAA